MGRGDRRKDCFAHGRGAFAKQPSLLVTGEDLLEPGHLARELWEVIENAVAPRLRQLGQAKGRAPHDPARMFAVWAYGLLDGFPSTRELEQRCRYDARYQFLSGGTSPDHTTLCRWFARFEPLLDELFALVLDAAKARRQLRYQLVAVDGTRLKASRSQWSRAASTRDPESKSMKTGRGFVVGYNAQAAVESGSGFVVGCHLTSSPNDMNALKAVLDSIPETPSTLVADAGYDTSANLHAAESCGIVAIINPDGRPTGPFHVSEEGHLECPAGHRALKHCEKKQKDLNYDVYRVSRCAGCPLQPSCNPGRSDARVSVPVGLDPSLRLRNRERARSEEGKRALRARGPTIERFFAQMKAHRNFTRFRRNGLAKASSEWLLACISHNLGALAQLFLAVLAMEWKTKTALVPHPAQHCYFANTA